MKDKIARESIEWEKARLERMREDVKELSNLIYKILDHLNLEEKVQLRDTLLVKKETK